ncbi:MAG TPA: [FeFe] hydrogenase H-cluster radical SAM maturase HydG [Nitratidesulfovibrio sp.]|nr:[FeFe] hydrogenase H-cluster radical SAM maturase HydG [Nitratidesulfovibrio sp.]
MGKATDADRDVSWLDDSFIADTLARNTAEDAGKIREVLTKARELEGLDHDDVAALMHVKSPGLVDELFDTARRVKEEIYGNRLVMFAPLYISNLCANECLYCAFRATNKDLDRRALSMDEVADETRVLVRQGHKRVLLVAGESYPGDGFEYVLKAIDAVYSVREESGEIRRVNVNVAPLTVEDFTRLKERGIGTYQLFQETYHRPTYSRVHVGGLKRDFDWRASAMDRAMRAGIDDVGLGVLYGLADWRFDTLALMSHIRHLEDRFGVGCHTISVPRIEPAVGSEMASCPPQAVTDDEFRKLVAILRLAVPYTGLIMSTRENAEVRHSTLALGVSQISAGSRTNPGGYMEAEKFESSQFQLGDHRSLSEVVADIGRMGYIPSFCTACYRLGRTGQDFMDLAKPGLIKEKCAPNALSTFLEYLIDYGSPMEREVGQGVIAAELGGMDERTRRVAERMLGKVQEGRRDVFC